MKRYSFCPVCGSRYAAVEPGAAVVSLLVCASCSFQFWQNSKPAVGALVTRVTRGSDEVLLTRRGIQPFQGMWDLPGGFLDNGEMPEAGLARELEEELGVRIERPRLLSIGIDEYPGDETAQEARFVLSLLYRCDLAPGASIAAADDVAEAAWFPLDAPPETMAFESNRKALEELRVVLRTESARSSGSG